MSNPRALTIEFYPLRRGPSATGVALCIAGLAAAVACAISFNGQLAERAHLEGELEAHAGPRHSAAQQPAVRSGDEQEAAKALRELSIPWSPLLAELESASHDFASKVSLLQVEPDAEKKVVRITAEVHSLPDALAYLKRLQESKVLRYPMLESHERRKDDPQHPLRIKLVAEWRS